MNTQEFFDASVAHLRKQGCVAMFQEDFASSCAYRTEDGLMCAVGGVIPEPLLKKIADSPSNKYTGVTTLMNRFPEVNDLFKDVAPGVLSTMQTIHDSFEPTQWEEAFLNTAQAYNLTLKEKA